MGEFADHGADVIRKRGEAFLDALQRFHALFDVVLAVTEVLFGGVFVDRSGTHGFGCCGCFI